MEVFKNVLGFNYEVSNLGNVRSMPRYVNLWHGGKRLVKGGPIKPIRLQTGYYHVNFSRKLLLLHRIVASLFIPNPNNYPTVNHIDGDKSNNCVNNLEWATQRENVSHSINRKRTSKFTGVSSNKTGKWTSAIHINGKTKILGHFDNEGSAADAYQNALKANGIINRYLTNNLTP